MDKSARLIIIIIKKPENSTKLRKFLVIFVTWEALNTKQQADSPPLRLYPFTISKRTNNSIGYYVVSFVCMHITF